MAHGAPVCQLQAETSAPKQCVTLTLRPPNDRLVHACCPQGVISLQQQPSSVELCLSPPSEGSVGAQQTVAYTPRLAPGSVTWQLKKTVQLPPVFADGVVQMIQGDTVVRVGSMSDERYAGCFDLRGKHNEECVLHILQG
jgi:hypothetical protein